MKKLSLITILICLAQIVFAQNSESFDRSKSNATYSGSKSRFEVSVSPGFYLGGKITNLKIGNSFDYKVAFSFKLPTKNSDIELSYTGAFPNGILLHEDGHNDLDMKSYISFIQLGYKNYLVNGNFKPYWLCTVGAFNINTKPTSVLFHENPEDYSFSKWMFAMALGAGCRYDITNKIAINLEARLLMPMIFTFTGVGINIGTGGIYPSLNLNSPYVFFQGDFSLGFIYKL